jgi:hypothetical protein
MDSVQSAYTADENGGQGRSAQFYSVIQRAVNAAVLLICREGQRDEVYGIYETMHTPYNTELERNFERLQIL